MKKFIALSLTALMFCQSVFAADISVRLNGENIEFQTQSPVITEGRTLIPLRGVFEKLGYEITWDASEKSALFTSGDTVVKVTVNSPEFTLNGEAMALDVPAQIINGSMMLPLRAIGEAAGLEVDWDSDTKTVDLKSEEIDARNDDVEFKFDDESGKATLTPKSEVTTEETTEEVKAPPEVDFLSSEITAAQNYVLFTKTVSFVTVYMSAMGEYNTMLNSINDRSDDDKIMEELKYVLDFNSATLERAKAIEKNYVNDEVLNALIDTIKKADYTYTAFLEAFEEGNGHQFNSTILSAVSKYNASVDVLQDAMDSSGKEYLEDSAERWNWSYDDLSDDEAKEVEEYQKKIGEILEKNLEMESTIRKRERTNIEDRFSKALDNIESEIAYVVPPEKCRVDHCILLEGIKAAREYVTLSANMEEDDADFVYAFALAVTFNACVSTCAGEYYDSDIIDEEE